MTGFLNLPNSNAEWEMPKNLQSFFDDGEPPLYMTFGSCMQFDLASSTKLLIEAARLSGKRTIIQSDWSLITKPTGPNIFYIESAPHSEVFPRCSLIVHHGGAGTTQSALLAGKPSVVVAHGFDQPYWGNQLKAMGVGANVLNRTTVTAKQLSQQIEQVCSSNVAEVAERLGKQMRQENGVSRAVDCIHALKLGVIQICS
jgi:UDP:flavonoid glycosyltransferase YjiC (YdhE family)